MTRLRVTFVGVFLFLTVMWLLSLSAGAFAGFWPTRNTVVYYTGILAIGFISVGVMLAARPVQRFCGPLGLGNALRAGLIARGFSAHHFHQELFDMR